MSLREHKQHLTGERTWVGEVATFGGGKSGVQPHNNLCTRGNLSRAADKGESAHYALTDRTHHHRHRVATEADMLFILLDGEQHL